MKRFCLLACALALIAAPSGASSLGLGVAYHDTEGAADDNGAGVRLSVDAGQRWNVDLRASFFDGHALVSGPRAISVEATPIDLGLSYDLNPDGKATVFVGGGLNHTIYQAGVFNTLRGEHEQSRVDDEPGWYAVIGVEGSVGKVGFFAEALYRQSKPAVDGDGVAELGTVAVDFAGAGAAVGVCYRW